MKITECKLITINKHNNILPAYELICPCCKHKLIIETEIADNVSNVYCFYCRAKVKAKAQN